VQSAGWRAMPPAPRDPKGRSKAKQKETAGQAATS